MSERESQCVRVCLSVCVRGDVVDPPGVEPGSNQVCVWERVSGRVSERQRGSVSV